MAIRYEDKKYNAALGTLQKALKKIKRQVEELELDINKVDKQVNYPPICHKRESAPLPLALKRTRRRS
jgi:phage shock protein A